jgi:hypothetical protein
MYRQTGAITVNNEEAGMMYKGRIVINTVPVDGGNALIGVEYAGDTYNFEMAMVTLEDAAAGENLEAQFLLEGLHTVEVVVRDNYPLYDGAALWLTTEGKLTTEPGYQTHLPVGICIEPQVYVTTETEVTVYTQMCALKRNKF